MTLSLNLEQKQAVVSEVAGKLATAQAVIVAEYRGLSVEKATALRATARNSGVSLKVLRNSLARRAVKGTPFEKLGDQLYGPLMYGFATDPVAGAMPNTLMSAKEIDVLAKLPGRQELLASLVGTMQAPIVKLVRTMNEVPGKFVRALAAVRDQKEAATA